MLHLLNKYTLASAILLTPAVVFAEVSDKMPSLFSLWMFWIIAALVCFAATFFLKWYGTIVAVFPLFWFVLDLIELHFNDIGTALYREQGLTYFIQSYLAVFLILLATLAGIFFNKKVF
jgi:hypothetical protein